MFLNRHATDKRTMNERLEKLFQGYIDNTLTDEEHLDLMKIINAKEHSEEMKNMIDTMFKKDYPVEEDMQVRLANEVLQNIIASDQTQTKVVQFKPVRTWRWVAAAAVLVIAVTAVWWTASDKTTSENTLAQVERVEPLFATGKRFIELPDGTKATMNEGSVLTHTAEFGRSAREVTVVKGEVYFDVTHNAKVPFRVRVGNVVTEVLGTAFNVKADSANHKVIVTVTRGKVQVGDGVKVYGFITPNQQIAVNTETNAFVQSNTEAEKAIAWKSKFLILEDVSMETAAVMIEEKYNTRIIFANDEVKKCRFSMTFLNDEDLEYVIKVISGITQMQYKFQQDGTIKLDGKGCQ